MDSSSIPCQQWKYTNLAARIALCTNRVIVLGALIEKSNSEEGINEKEIKELNAISNFLNKFLDKTFASQTENKNEITIANPPTVFMPQPKELSDE